MENQAPSTTLCEHSPTELNLLFDLLLFQLLMLSFLGLYPPPSKLLSLV